MGRYIKRINSFFENTVLELAVATLFLLSFVVFTGTSLRHGWLSFVKIPRSISQLSKKRDILVDQVRKKAIDQVEQVEKIAQEHIINEAYKKSKNGNKQAKENLKKQLLEILSKTPYSEFLFVDFNGQVVLASNEYEGVSLHADQFKDTAVAQSVARVSICLSTDISRFSFDSTLKKSVLYITTLILDDLAPIGILSVAIDLKELNSWIPAYNTQGKSDEVLFASAQPDDILIINQPRLHESDEAIRVPYRKVQPTPIQYAIEGEKDTGTALDYRNKRTYAAWEYISIVNWGIVVKQDQSELFASLQKNTRVVFISFILVLILSILMIFFYFKELRNFFKEYTVGRQIKAYVFHRRTIRMLCWVGLCVSLCGALFIIYRLKSSRDTLLYRVQTKAKIKTEDAINQINYYLFEIKGIADSLADDVSKGRLTKKELEERMRLEMKENDFVLGITVAYKPEDAQDQSLFAPHIVRIGNTILFQNLPEKYTGVDQPENDWYIKTIKNQKAQWFDPIEESISKDSAVVYAKPFYAPQDTNQTNPIGVVRILLDINKIKVITSALAVGQTGYAFLVTKTGRFLYHPIQEYVRKGKTIFDIAREEEDDNLRKIGIDATQGKTSFLTYEDGKTDSVLWTYYQPIPFSDWSLGVTFAENEITLPQREVRHQLLIILMCVMAFLFFGILLGTHIEKGTIQSIRSSSIMISILFLVGTSCIWYLVRNSYVIQDESGVPIVNQVSINAYLIDVDQQRQDAKQPPLIAIPTGLYIYSIDTTQAQYLAFSGYVWQVLDKDKHKNIEPGVRVPQATRFDVKLIYQDETEFVKVLGWRINATVYQAFDYSEFPFDVLKARLQLESRDLINPVILVPDIAGYQFMQPNKLPGIHAFVELPGFTLTQSFFSINQETRATNLGIEENTSYKSYTLAFNVIFSRNLLNAFIIYFLPLIIILISMFVILIIQRSAAGDPFKSVGAYTAFFFSVVVLQRSLREQYPTGDVLYFEYFFFFTYITILILVLYSLLEYMKGKNVFVKERLLPIFRLVFWPLELGLWFITSILVFYN